MISVSFLKSKDERKNTINKINASAADLIHVDLMDGVYVQNKNFEINEILNTLKDTTKLLDIHLMVREPFEYIKELIKLNVWAITFHLDATENPLEIIEYLKLNNIKVGIAINPNDDINVLNDYFDKIDYVLVMSVIPGEGGQKFMSDVLEKIEYLKDKKVLIGIDGGINHDTIKLLKGYKIDNIISGSFICMNDDYNRQIKILKDNLN